MMPPPDHHIHFEGWNSLVANGDGSGSGSGSGRKLPSSPPPAVHDNSKEDAAVDAAAGVVDGDNQSHIRFAYSAFAFFMYVGASPPHVRNLLTN